MLRHAQTALAVLFVGAFALASGTGARARFAPPGTSAADITAAAIAATGWTYVTGTNTSTATGKVIVANDFTVSGGINVLTASPNVIRTGGQTDYINMGEASGIEIFPSSGQRVRILSAVYFDGNQQNAALRGTITLAAGTGTATVNASAKCVCGTETANPVSCAVAATTLTCTGTGTEACNYHCQ